MADPATPAPSPADRARKQGLRDPSIDQLPEDRPEAEPGPEPEPDSDRARPRHHHRSIDDLKLPPPDHPDHPQP
ncbi:hypothetical protein [Kitasatospora sp. NPDC059673]|uniref:hypothetical protein n=1 Tax=Kitasatospora sp. NPDC059673 TaxID=3346901 RepID=UPI0036C80374